MACLTVFVLLVDLIFLAGILSPGWVRVTEEADPLSSPDTNSTNYGLFFYSKCSKEGCLTNMIYGESYNHTYQGESIYPRIIATEFHSCVAIVLNVLALFTTKCATKRNGSSSKTALTTLVLLIGSFFVTFNIIAEYLIIYLLAQKTSTIYIHPNPYDVHYVTSKVQTPYSLFITSLALLLQTFVIVFFFGKIWCLLSDASSNSEAPPPPYQSLRGNSTATRHDPSNVIQRPVVCNSSEYPDDEATRPLLGRAPVERPYHYETRPIRSPVPSAPGPLNPFDGECDQ